MQTLLKGACHALAIEEYTAAGRLCGEAQSHPERLFIDNLVLVELLKKQHDQPSLIKSLTSFAEAFEKKGLSQEAHKTYKLLFDLEKTPENCQKVITSYERLKKTKKQLQWYTTWLSLLIDKKDWPKASEVGKKALEKVSEAEKVPLYEELEIVHSHWNGHELKDLWNQLGNSYRANGQLAAAEKTYRKAFEKFHQPSHAIALAEVLSEQGKIQESVRTYYEAFAEAMLNQKMEIVAQCTAGIRKIDFHMEQLGMDQKMHLLTITHSLEIKAKVESLELEIRDLKLTSTIRKYLSEEGTSEVCEVLLRLLLASQNPLEKRNPELYQLFCEGLEHVNQIMQEEEQMPTTHLKLGYRKIGAEGAKALAAALERNQTLTSLDLSQNEIGTEGAKALAIALERNQTLTSLDLSSGKIGAEGAKALAIALERNQTLSSLDPLSRTKSEMREQKLLRQPSSATKPSLLLTSPERNRN